MADVSQDRGAKFFMRVMQVAMVFDGHGVVQDNIMWGNLHRSTIDVGADTLAEQKEVRKFITDLKINFPVWLGATTEDMARFGLGPALPGTAIIGRDGKIVAVYRGVIKEADLKKQLSTLIAKLQKEAKEQIALSKAQIQDTSSVPS